MQVPRKSVHKPSTACLSEQLTSLDMALLPSHVCANLALQMPYPVCWLIRCLSHPREYAGFRWSRAFPVSDLVSPCYLSAFCRERWTECLRAYHLCVPSTQVMPDKEWTSQVCAACAVRVWAWCRWRANLRREPIRSVLILVSITYPFLRTTLFSF